jgi:3-hydroxybutyryl-CoA dehydrogenase
MTARDKTRPIEFDPVGVIGLGLLGRGITASLLGAGFCVVAIDTQEKAQKEAHEYIQDAMSEMVRHGAASPQACASWMGRYNVSTSIHTLGKCKFIIESVLEDIAVKHHLFDQIETIVGEDVPIASNTSALPITVLQGGRRFPSRFLGMHWSEPAYSTRFLEIIRGEKTSDEVIESAMRLGEGIGKDPCIVEQDIPGFIVNRLGYALYREATHLLECGVGDVDTIDRAFRNAFGLWATLCGPFRWIDLTGGPAAYAKAMAGVLPSLSNASELPRILTEKQHDGERGTMNGRGFYTYGPADAQHWQKLLHEHAWEIRRLQQRYYPIGGNDDGK